MRLLGVFLLLDAIINVKARSGIASAKPSAILLPIA
jgi:hypothetical protein